MKTFVASWSRLAAFVCLCPALGPALAADGLHREGKMLLLYD